MYPVRCEVVASTRGGTTDATRFDLLAKVLPIRRSRRAALCTGGTVLARGALSRFNVVTRAQNASDGAGQETLVAAVDETLKQAFVNGDRAALKTLYAPNAVLAWIIHEGVG